MHHFGGISSFCFQFWKIVLLGRELLFNPFLSLFWICYFVALQSVSDVRLVISHIIVSWMWYVAFLSLLFIKILLYLLSHLLTCPVTVALSCLTVMCMSTYYFVLCYSGFTEFDFYRLVKFGESWGNICSYTFSVCWISTPPFKTSVIHNVEITDCYSFAPETSFFSSDCISLYSGFCIKIF